MKDTDALVIIDRNKKLKPIQWVGLCLCVFLYVLCLVMIVRLTSKVNEFYINVLGISVSRNIINGIIAQIQVLLSVFMTLYLKKNGYVIAVLLNFIVAAGAIRASVFYNNMNTLPGTVIPIATIFIISTIYWYSIRLKSQIMKEFQNNIIIQENEEKLKQLAYYDSLTGLPNRKMMFDEIDRLVASYHTEKKGFIILYLDLDDFKKVNDTASHSAGDIILVKIVQRWKALIRECDILGRFGGDEFGLLITTDMDDNELMKYVERFRDALKESLLIARKEFFITASYGIVRFPKDGLNVTELMMNADIAMNKAKAAGKNEVRTFDYVMQDDILKRLELENGLLNCIKNNELRVVFQPLFECKTKKLRGFEALVRWNYPAMGLVSPASFIPIAEETGMINEIGRWIISSVLTRFIEFHKSYQSYVVVSINISVVQLAEPSFVPMLQEALEETGFNSSLLELEITESVMISFPEHIIDVLNQLRDLGIRIALDDFGTGYASLSYLQMLPINVLKIDKTFIDKIDRQDSESNIVGYIIYLAHQLGIEVVAEGVETEEQLDYLIEQNCDYVQGYLLSRPLEEDKVIKLLESR